MYTIILTLDDKNAVSFAGKRQSKDAAVSQRICDIMGEAPLYMREKSVSFFNDVRPNIQPIENIEPCGVAFLEEVPSADIISNTDRIIVFRWNRNYPSLVTERVNLDGWTKTVAEEFSGTSHNNITLEVYTK